jgi:hypothetical protein
MEYNMEYAILYIFLYFIIGIIVSLINIHKVKDEKFEWVMYAMVFWPIYVPCILYDTLVNAIEYVNKKIKKYKK